MDSITIALLLASALSAVAQEAPVRPANPPVIGEGSAGRGGAEDRPSFQSAKPVWPEGRETDKNLTVAFRAAFEAPAGKKVLLRATGSTLYRIFINGAFLGHGPARGPHGWYRVDEIDLTAKLRPGANVIAFEVAGYNVNSYYLLDQPSFLQAEVIAGATVLASTGGEGGLFEAGVLGERVQKVQRYSFQRPFSEVYRLAPGSDRWRAETAAPWLRPCALFSRQGRCSRVACPTANSRCASRGRSFRRAN